MLCQHDHRQTLAAALSMPNDSALAVAPLVVSGNRLHDFLYGKVLLIAANLFYVRIEENEIAHQFENTALVEQRNDIPVLHSYLAASNQLLQTRLPPFAILLLPYVPELLWRPGRCVFDAILVCRHDDLRVFEKLRNIFSLLIADHLRDSLILRNMRRFAFDYRKWDAVDEQHDIRTGIMLLVLAFNRKFLRHMEYIVLRIFPIDILQIEAEHLAFADRLQIAPAQKKRIVDFLAGSHKSVGQRFVQILHRPLDVRRRKFVFGVGIRIPVQTSQLSAQDILQKDMVSAAALKIAVRRRNVRISHRLEKLDGRDMAGVRFKIGILIVHDRTPYSAKARRRLNSSIGGNARLRFSGISSAVL